MDERWKPSVTVAAIASRQAGGRREYLVVEEETADGLRLNNPAGHLEPGESLQQAVVREALEETGRCYAPSRLVGVYLARVRLAGDARDDATYLRFAFAGTAGDADPQRRLDKGIVGTLWLTLDELRRSRHRHRSPLVLRCVEDDLAGRHVPLDVLSTDLGLAGGPRTAA
ncbi:MAG TPA: NUDIX hydrolase [Caldimonas sp.]|nr:NUDIX hydrolase [Caldimonas sp.]